MARPVTTAPLLLTAGRTSGIACPGGPAGHSRLAQFLLKEVVVNGEVFMVCALTPRRGTPPGQGGIQILAAATLADVVDVDVPVNMQHMFQQYSVHQHSGGYSSCYTETGMHSVVVQKTVEIPQLQFLDLVVVPVSCNDKFWYRQCRKLWNEDLLRHLVSGSHLSGVGLA